MSVQKLYNLHAALAQILPYPFLCRRKIVGNYGLTKPSGTLVPKIVIAFVFCISVAQSFQMAIGKAICSLQVHI